MKMELKMVNGIVLKEKHDLECEKKTWLKVET